MAQSTGESILSVLKADFLTAVGTPLLNALQSIQKTPTPLNEAAQWLLFVESSLAAAPVLEATLAQQIAAELQTKVTAAIAAAQAAATTPK